MQVGVCCDTATGGRHHRSAGGSAAQVLPVRGGPSRPWHLAHPLLHLGRHWPHQVGPCLQNVELPFALLSAVHVSAMHMSDVYKLAFLCMTAS